MMVQVDAGDVIGVITKEINSSATVTGLSRELLELATPMIVDKVNIAIKGGIINKSKQNEAIAKYYGNPTKREVRDFIKGGVKFY